MAFCASTDSFCGFDIMVKLFGRFFKYGIVEIDIQF